MHAVLGSGFASVVYLGNNLSTDEAVCVKAVDLLAMGSHPEKTELIHKEIQFLQQFHSKFIVQLYDVYESPTFVYLVMELCPGGDLYKMLKIAPFDLPVNFASIIMKQIVQGCQQIHSKDVIHRDLKTENVFISKFPQKEGEEIVVKIGDLGFCISRSQICKMEEANAIINVGSPIYMSPQASAQHRYSFASDIYAIGIIWYEILHKVAPWEALTEAQLLNKKLNQPIKHWRHDIPAKIKQAISQCLSNDPEKRPSIKQILSVFSEPSDSQNPTPPIQTAEHESV